MHSPPSLCINVFSSRSSPIALPSLSFPIAFSLSLSLSLSHDFHPFQHSISIWIANLSPFSRSFSSLTLAVLAFSFFSLSFLRYIIPLLFLSNLWSFFSRYYYYYCCCSFFSLVSTQSDFFLHDLVLSFFFSLFEFWKRYRYPPLCLNCRSRDSRPRRARLRGLPPVATLPTQQQGRFTSLIPRHLSGSLET